MTQLGEVQYPPPKSLSPSDRGRDHVRRVRTRKRINTIEFAFGISTIEDSGSKSGLPPRMHNTDLMSHIDGLYSYAMSLTHDPIEADDLVEKTYIRALQAMVPLRFEQSVKRRLFEILRTEWSNGLHPGRSLPRAIERKRSAATRVPVQTKNSIAPPGDGKEAREVKNAIRGLPLEFREVILLREYEEFSYHEIATILNCPPKRVVSLLDRARAILHIALRISKHAG